jgi:Tol biopolymer transport system component
MLAESKIADARNVSQSRLTPPLAGIRRSLVVTAIVGLAAAALLWATAASSATFAPARADLRCCSTPAWSPDGRQLAFRAGERLAVIGSDGQRFRRAPSPVTGDYFPTQYRPVWSHDSFRIAFTEARSYAPGVGGRGVSTFRVFSVDRLARDMRLEGESVRHPSWSPDGRHLAVELYGGCCGLEPDGVAVVDRRTGERRLLEHRPATGSHGWGYWAPRWAPKGNLIAALAGDPCCMFLSLNVMNGDGTGEPRVIGVRASEAPEFSWSPDGMRLAYVNRAGKLALISVRVGRSRPMSIGGGPLSWSPDGRSIALLVVPQAEPFRRCIRVVSVATRRARIAACRRGFELEYEAPSWAPDSRRVALGTRGGILIVRIRDGSSRFIQVPRPW